MGMYKGKGGGRYKNQGWVISLNLSKSEYEIAKAKIAKINLCFMIRDQRRYVNQNTNSQNKTIHFNLRLINRTIN